MEMVDEQEIRRLLWERTHRMGQKGLNGKVAQEMGVSGSYLSQVVRGKLRPNDKVLGALGFRRVEGFVRVDG